MLVPVLKCLCLVFMVITNCPIPLHSVLVSSKRSNNPVINWDSRSLIGIISGINYIHGKDILHNDIKEAI